MNPPVKRYLGPDREYLKIIDCPRMDGFCIAWYYPNNEDLDLQGLGALLGEFEDTDEIPSDLSSYEFWVAQRAAKPFSELSLPDGELVFETKHSANAALRAANIALHKGEGKPWPEWALKAKEAGWTPPEGWTP